ncbi:hypothetical protein IFM58399_04739 [Aspergillus lentulus]|uniref:MARVEL domain-containing protein n=1 Tax=Aspergillus lentulus TaxID=293939 RepID=A0AAN5YTJ4_ASPLE|nr:uncharacterized protein IFM58399_04739 [Aspergillus lentulus]KAF4162616.1 hypothetical protein CNMCM6936_001805 [Aspergillus lentulus]KAF4174210.1 hypothetical protein CNMCM8060_008951 [Aspergillus lentulus]KAF4182590.1 hypothetical protein CNMCM7927_009602 [Aspergillus lentulus]KAF4193163.1 hypothetical protein CNMCM8694_009164 [Aspergillus lentulus]KAF4207102.1 hypothetical protein CNMCM8927_003935 [Aspergillus lentulus]
MARYGALGATFQIARIVQACSLIAIIGLTANFIAEIVSKNATPPSVFIGTITVTCIAVIYCVISFILFLDNILPFLASAIMDALVLIAVIIVAVIIGKPLSYLECDVIGDLAGDGSSAYAFATSLDNYLDHLGGKVDYKNWIAASRGVCLEAKSIWGLSIALCILFFFSAVCCVCLWRQKKATSGEKLDG